MDEVESLKCAYSQLGRSLRLRDSDLKVIRQTYPAESEQESALNDVLVLWLQQKYNAERFGPPTWRLLVEAVDKKSCGDYHKLAKEIALKHPAGT